MRPETKTTLPAGRIVANRYEILASLGEGGMGAVYRAHDKELDEEIALKILLPDRLGDPAMLARFRREVKIARKITHPNVCRVFDFGEDEGLRFLTMEFVHGETLRHWLSSQKTPSPERALTWFEQIARGVAAAHDKGVIHRDLKPENILVRRDRDDMDDQIVVADFGLAREPEKDTKRTTANTAGTPAYMSPEQLRGEDLDARSDVFALGIVGFELLAGHSPFGSGSRGEVTVAILRRAPEPLPKIPGLSDATHECLAAFFERALAKDKHQRFATASAVCRALSKARAGLPWHDSEGSAPSVPPSISPKPWQQRRRFFVILGVALGASALYGLNSLQSNLPEHLRGISLTIPGLSSKVAAPSPTQSAGSANTAKKAIIHILPGQNLSGDSRWDGLAASLPETLAGGLRTIKTLHLRLPGEQGEQSTWTLRGNVQQRGETLVLSAQFISTENEMSGEPIDIASPPDEVAHASSKMREAAADEARLLLRQFARRTWAIEGTQHREAREKLLQYMEMIGTGPKREHRTPGLKLINEALELDPNYTPALVERSLLRSLGPESADERTQAAIADLDQALTLSPNDPFVAIMRCRVLQAATAASQVPSDKAVHQAMEACRTAQHADPSSAYVSIALARIHDLLCQDDEAIALLSGSLEQDRTLAGRALAHLLVLVLKHGQAHQAERLSEELVALFEEEYRLGEKARTRRAGAPPIKNAYFLRGAALLHVGKAQQAQVAFEKELSFLSPERPNKVLEAAALLGLQQSAIAQKKKLAEPLARRAASIEQEWLRSLRQKSEEAMALLDAYSFVAPEVGVKWIGYLPKPETCRDAVGMALLAAQGSRPDLAKEMLARCAPREEWERSCVTAALSLASQKSKGM